MGLLWRCSFLEINSGMRPCLRNAIYPTGCGYQIGDATISRVFGQNPRRCLGSRRFLFSAKRILHAARSILHLARDLVALPFSLELGISSDLAHDFLNGAFDL